MPGGNLLSDRSTCRAHGIQGSQRGVTLYLKEVSGYLFEQSARLPHTYVHDDLGVGRVLLDLLLRVEVADLEHVDPDQPRPHPPPEIVIDEAVLPDGQLVELEVLHPGPRKRGQRTAADVLDALLLVAGDVVFVVLVVLCRGCRRRRRRRRVLLGVVTESLLDEDDLLPQGLLGLIQRSFPFSSEPLLLLVLPRSVLATTT